MPLYEYQCEACGQRFEVIQKFSETTEVCRLCGKGPVRRLLSSPAIQFKGSGFYITDYAQKGKAEGGKSSSGTSSGDDAGKAEAPKSDAAKTETPAKTETTTKSETKSDTASTATTPAKSKE